MVSNNEYKNSNGCFDRMSVIWSAFYLVMTNKKGSYTHAANSIEIPVGTVGSLLSSCNLDQIVNTIRPDNKRIKTQFAEQVKQEFDKNFGDDSYLSATQRLTVFNCPVLVLIYAIYVEAELSSKHAAKILNCTELDLHKALKEKGWYDLIAIAPRIMTEAEIFKPVLPLTKDEVKQLVNGAFSEFTSYLDMSAANKPVNQKVLNFEPSKKALTNPVSTKTVAAKKAIAKQAPTEKAKVTYLPKTYVIEEDSTKSPEEILQEHNVDTDIYAVVATKRKLLNRDVDGEPLYRTYLSLKRKPSTVWFLSQAMAQIAAGVPFVAEKKYPAVKEAAFNRVLEVTIPDLHFGLTLADSDGNVIWDRNVALNYAKNCIELLIKRAEAFGPFSKIVFTVGNDLTHIDNVDRETSNKTPMVDADSYQYCVKTANEYVGYAVNRLLEVAPVHIVMVPGNHDHSSNIAMGEFLAAIYANNPNVTVDNSEKPYKFFVFGACVIGYEHGKNIPPSRLSGIMQNERGEACANAVCKEWHLGHFHRRGDSRPVMEDHGIGIKYLPTLALPNEWHNIHGYNGNRRAATGFVLDYESGLISEIHVNLDLTTGRVLGVDDLTVT